MRLLLVTGLSGAGKSNVLRVLEDVGYYCVDNIPAKLVPSFIETCKSTEPKIERAAIVIDSRERAFKTDPNAISNIFGAQEVEYQILFLDCKDDVLKQRYNETRRRHPVSTNIGEGIRIEREILQPLRDRANYVIDTSHLKPLELHRLIEQITSGGTELPFRLIVSSFGYKRGIPMEADIVMDMRFSENPFYVTELRSLSGLDKPVRDFVLSDKAFVSTLDDVERMLKRLIPSYKQQGKRRLMVAFGCTGGRHRSVCAAYEMYKRMQNECYTVLEHRDYSSEAEDIEQRFGSD